MEKIVAHDGADGLAAGTAAIVAGAYALLHGIRDSGGSPGLESGATAWGIAGGSFAFLCFNFPPAKLFMGDSGSTVLGFALATLALDSPGSRSPAPARPFFLLLSAALPLLDLVFGVIRRARAGRSPFCGDRSHSYDLLFRRGWTARSVALTCYAATASLAVAGWISLRAGAADFAVLSALIFGAFTWAGTRLGALRLNEDSLPETVSVEKTREPQWSRGERSSV